MHRTRIRTALVVFAVAPFSGLAQAGTSDEGLIRATRARSNAAIAAHDPAAMASAWLPEYHAVYSTNAQVNGREAARSYFAERFAGRPDVIYMRLPRSVVVNAKWGQAAEAGRWTGHWTQRDGVTRVGGDYYAKWQKVNGQWLILAEIFVQVSCTGTSYCAVPPPVTQPATPPE
jgi:hypothetical protein